MESLRQSNSSGNVLFPPGGIAELKAQFWSGEIRRNGQRGWSVGGPLRGLIAPRTHDIVLVSEVRGWRDGGCWPLATSWHKNKMDTILQTIFSNLFSRVKIDAFWLKFHWNLFPMMKLTISHHWFRQRLVTEQATGHYMNQWWHNLLTHICITLQLHWENEPANNNEINGLPIIRPLPSLTSQSAKSCRPQMDPMLAPWTLLSGFVPEYELYCEHIITRDANSFSWAKIWEFSKWQCDVIDDIIMMKNHFIWHNLHADYDSAAKSKLSSNYINPGYFTLAAIALKPQQIPMFLHISARVWGRQ